MATLCDWLKISHQFLNQSEVKSKPIVTLLARVFPRSVPDHSLHAFAFTSDWFIRLSASVVIGQSNCFRLGFRHASENLSQIKMKLAGKVTFR